MAHSPDDPCVQIQADLSAMLDGELDAASVRRVMVHSDACPSCRSFLDGIRSQARAHRKLHEALVASSDELIEVPLQRGGSELVPAGELRRQLTENRRQLARILYELGRGFVLMGISPKFSRIVSREPVPIPDMRQRGQNLVDEVSRLTGDDQAGSEWVRARELFGFELGKAPEEHLRTGVELLREVLGLDAEFHDARIYLGHAHHVEGDREEACRQFQKVLDSDADLSARGFALLNLGNVYLEGEELEDAERCFLELVSSGAVKDRPQFAISYFNLALTYGMQGRFEECQSWLSRLYSELPHKRRMIAEEFRARADFLASLSRHPDFYESLATSFPCWFPKKEAC